MSRIGKMPVAIPKEVKVSCDATKVDVTGPKGHLACDLPGGVTVSVEEGKVLVHRGDDERSSKASHGLVRSLISNMVSGVTQGFERKLEIVGVGFRAEVQGETLKMTLGFSHPVLYPVPKGIRVEVDKQTLVTIKGIDKRLVGTVAAQLRSIKPPEPYKGKGVRYQGERIRKKVGKTKA